MFDSTGIWTPIVGYPYTEVEGNTAYLVNWVGDRWVWVRE